MFKFKYKALQEEGKNPRNEKEITFSFSINFLKPIIDLFKS
ncbi:hypothetical protein SAMN04488168_12363 [Bacillus sp. 491mf]|nr:hypothetical protein [Bacillus sp. 491mf]SFD18952.1 hypothetical protein SAMN04488168_12363 [Bacillus sp. 491mf]